jgi:hypothetical protein
MSPLTINPLDGDAAKLWLFLGYLGKLEDTVKSYQQTKTLTGMHDEVTSRKITKLLIELTTMYMEALFREVPLDPPH